MNAHFKCPPFRSDKWRQSARGKNCTLRLCGCNGDTETTVLAHLRMFGWGGMGSKPHDFLAVYACQHCHDILDRRDASAPIGFDDILRALGETLIEHYKEERIGS